MTGIRRHTRSRARLGCIDTAEHTTMKIVDSQSQTKLSTAKTRGLLMALAFGLAWPLTGCGQSKQESKVNGLSGVVFNYSDEAIARVWVDGEGIGGPAEPVKPGDVTGGGQTCCLSMDASRGIVPVKILPGEGDEYTVQAVVEQPWPKDATTVIVHILPKRKIVIETTLGINTSPRSDLINSRIAELGIPKEVNADQYMIPERNRYREYMELNKDER